MPRLKSTSYSSEYDALRSSKHISAETNDCTVIAVAAACNVPYAMAHAKMQELGRRNGRGASVWMVEKAIESFGYKVEERIHSPERFISQYPGVHSRLKHITTHHPRRFRKVWKQYDNCTFLFHVRRHVLAVKNGEVLDWSINRSLRVEYIWKITKA